MRFTRRRDRCSTHATQHTALGPQRTRHHSRGAPWRKLAHARNQQPQVLLSAGDQLPQACGNQQPQAVLSLAFCPAGLIIIIIILRRPTAAGVSVRRTPAAAGASQPRSLLRRRTTTAGVSVRRKPAAAGAPFVHTEGDWPCLSPLVGSCLRRDTPEAAAILGKSLSAIASTEELVLTASSVLLVLPASSVHHADYTIAITQRRFTTEYPSSYPPRAISLRISSSSSQLAHETSTADSRRFTSHGTYASSSKVGKDIYMLIS